MRIDPHHGAARAEAGAEHHEGEAGAALERAFVRAGLDPPPGLPVELFRSGGDDLFQRIVGELHFPGGPAHVPEREIHRVDAHFVGDVVHDRLDAIDAMGVGRSAEIA